MYDSIKTDKRKEIDRDVEKNLELNYISLNSDDDEAMNTTVAVENGAGIYCMMAFETASDSAVELQITEPTAEAKSLVKLKLEE